MLVCQLALIKAAFSSVRVRLLVFVAAKQSSVIDSFTHPNRDHTKTVKYREAPTNENRLSCMTHAEEQLPDELHPLFGALQRADFNAARQHVTELSHTPHLDGVLAMLVRYAPQHPQALELLLEALDQAGTVRRFAGASLLDQNAVDDVSQNAMISIADSIDSYNGRGKVTTWVHTIVQRRVVDHLRRQRATVPLDQHDISPVARMSSIIATRTTVHQALETLPELYRRPVVL